MSRISTQLFVLAVSSFVLSCYAAGNTSRIDESAASTYPEHLARFPNGELVAVTMRPFPPMEVELSPKFASEHDELVSKAKAGDENAAYTLAESLRTCDQEGYGSVGELNQAMDDLRSTHSYRDRRGNLIELSGSYDGSIDLDAVARKLKTVTEACDGLSDAEVGQWQSWMRNAGDAGVFAAAWTYAQWVNGPRERFDAYRRVWSLGHPTGLMFMADAYHRPWSGIEADPVKAYAYALLYLELTRLAYADDDGLVSPYFSKIQEATAIHERAAELTHAQTAEATALAIDVLRTNQNCCVGHRSYGSLVRQAQTD